MGASPRIRIGFPKSMIAARLPSDSMHRSGVRRGPAPSGGPPAAGSASRFGVRVSADRRGLELDDAARAYFRSEPFVGADSLDIGPRLVSPTGGRHLAEWLFEQVRWGDRTSFWLLRCPGGAWFKTSISGSRAAVELLGGDVRSRLPDHVPSETCNVAAAIRAVLDRTAWADRIVVEETIPRQAGAGYCAVVALLVLEWASFDLAAERDSVVVIGLSDGSLQFASSGIAHWIDACADRRTGSSQQPSPDLLPIAMLRELGVGAGVWRIAAGGGASIGLVEAGAG